MDLLKHTNTWVRDKISLYEESNTAGKYSLILQYDYKKHYMDRGTQVSYFATGK